MVKAKSKSRFQMRHFYEKGFQALGLLSIGMALLFLIFFLVSIVKDGYTAYIRHEIALPLYFDGDGFETEIAKALRSELGSSTPDLSSHEILGFLSHNAPQEIKNEIVRDPLVHGKTRYLWLRASDEVDLYLKGKTSRLNEPQIKVLEILKEKENVRSVFNWQFIFGRDSREPELAGIGGAFLGSLFVILITLLTSFPLGVGSAIYLEEFAPKNRLLHWIEININNLAAIPSIIFGLLGLVLFINIFHLPRPSALVGGLTLGLMTMPIIIVSTRTALQTVPQNIRDAALGLGASHVQAVFHHVVPLALPGILTGTILGIARALGETAPLLMVGMVAFIAEPPHSIWDPATTLPVQIFAWARSAEPGFVENTSGAIMALLLLLGILNGGAIILRKRFEHHW
ncbi:Phosphate transport system permease protein PstA [Candidatus Bealeia paramacronuclearis]|uniref:Phosphate transport system permease protein PstA n=1 Tax=Candidatus Bealeia paramacronuclearis TaxID=1921001 RepID=A0ABZ2C5X2_9PROT|nr:Phosphate transport system permease protein PstA [Candidatus Bealeia paramacronuclearis]